MNRYAQYLEVLKHPFEKLCKLEFLNPDNSVAFSLGTKPVAKYETIYDTAAFIEDGTINVNLQNGLRRTATITLSDVDDAYDFAVNHLWYGQTVRILMGVVLPDRTAFYLPQGVFYLDSPSLEYNPAQRTITYNLVDKWAYLDGSLFGTLDSTHVIKAGSTLLDNFIPPKATLTTYDISDISSGAGIITSLNGYYTANGNGESATNDHLQISDPFTLEAGTYLFDIDFPTNVPLIVGVYDNTNDTMLVTTESLDKTITVAATAECYLCAYENPNVSGRYSITFTPGIFSPNVPMRVNIFEAMASVLKWSRYNFEETDDVAAMLDNVSPVFTTYYDGKTYQTNDGYTVYMLDLPYDVTVSGDNATVADVLLALNAVINGWIGYDKTGALRIDASQDDITDTDKPVLWEFTKENSTFLGLTENAQNSDVKNDILIVGGNKDGGEVYGRASNFDPASDTNINLIGRRTEVETKAEYWNENQCLDLAAFRLKRKTVLQKTVSIQSGQLFHLNENELITVRRDDKPGNPVEKHVIQAYSLPIAETGAMTIEAVSVNDIDVATTLTSANLFPLDNNTYVFDDSTNSVTIDKARRNYAANGTTTSALDDFQRISPDFDLLPGTYALSINNYAGPFQFALFGGAGSPDTEVGAFTGTIVIGSGGTFHLRCRIDNSISDGIAISNERFTASIIRIA